MSTHEYDVVIVGAGIAGAIVAREIAEKNPNARVLVLEAGESALTVERGTLHQRKSAEKYREYVQRFFRQVAKLPNSPYPDNPNALSPSLGDTREVNDHGKPVDERQSYWVQEGPVPYGSNYTRVGGGTTMHFLGTALRMVPGDFEMQSRYGRGVDWPIGYADLRPYYEQSELEMGVSAEVEDQSYASIELPWDKPTFGDDYAFPMHRIPQSYWDQVLDEGTKQMAFELAGEDFPVRVVSTPQARNGMPNPRCIDPRTGTRFVPAGMVGDPKIGQRCEGNSSCIPICPVQAKYNAMKTLAAALSAGWDEGTATNRVTYQAQCVATHVELDANGRVAALGYKRYADRDEPAHESARVTGRIFVLAAHAVENVKILLASEGVARASGELGRNLMDHPYLLTWGLSAEPVGCYRGPGATSGIPTLRDGAFRSQQSAFRVEIGNWGWTLSDGAPFTQIENWVDGPDALFGSELRQRVQQEFPRHVRFGFLIEQLPDSGNYVDIDDRYRDQLGVHRPVIHYDIGQYERAGLAAAKQLWDAICKQTGIDDRTIYANDESKPVGERRFAEMLEYEGQPFGVYGSGHLVGTHRMGTDPASSVVNEWQRSHEHENLYLAGCGSMPTIGTSNPTLTMAALSFRTAEDILRTLQRGG